MLVRFMKTLRPGDLLDQLCRSLERLGRERRFDCFGKQAMLLIPRAGPFRTRAPGRAAQTMLGFVAQSLGEQWVIAVPLLVAGQWQEEEIGAFQATQDLRA